MTTQDGWSRNKKADKSAADYPAKIGAGLTTYTSHIARLHCPADEFR
ncbi:MAG TPA: hypothetical protein VGH19_20150 [Verrucomicrobiae bacterium]